ncbi:MAG: hypothetical protein QM754_12050 [Tepidisphaeraceae bacterium]
MISGGRFYSIGSAASRIGTVVSTFKRAAGELGQRPAFELDGVPIYTDAQVQTVEQAIERRTVRPVSGCDSGTPPARG